jgi:hypothetical protein
MRSALRDGVSGLRIARKFSVQLLLGLPLVDHAPLE